MCKPLSLLGAQCVPMSGLSASAAGAAGTIDSAAMPARNRRLSPWLRRQEACIAHFSPLPPRAAPAAPPFLDFDFLTFLNLPASATPLAASRKACANMAARNIAGVGRWAGVVIGHCGRNLLPRLPRPWHSVRLHGRTTQPPRSRPRSLPPNAEPAGSLVAVMPRKRAAIRWAAGVGGREAWQEAPDPATRRETTARR